MKFVAHATMIACECALQATTHALMSSLRLSEVILIFSLQNMWLVQ